MSEQKRQRQNNYSIRELDIIAEGVKVHGDVIFSSFTSTVTNERKKAIWNGIRDQVNACSLVPRSTEQIRKKWLDYRSQVKKKVAATKREAGKTGGGPAPPPLSDIEEKVASTIPECQLSGIADGMETFVGVTPLNSQAEADRTICEEDVTLAEQTCSSMPSTSSTGIEIISDFVERPAKKAKMSHANADFSERLFQLKIQKQEEESKYREERLRLERRNMDALLRIASALESIDSKLKLTDSYSLSPIISFHSSVDQ